MKVRVYFFLTCVLVLTAFIINAQDNAGSVITAENIKKHIYILASDSLQGRETGYSGQKKAAAYIASEFEKAGLISLSNDSDSVAYYQRILFVDRQDNKVELMPINGRQNNSGSKPLFLKNGLLFYGSKYRTQNEKTQVVYAGKNTDIKLNTSDTSLIIFLTANNAAEGIGLAGKVVQKTGIRKIMLYIPYDEYKAFYNEYIHSQYMTSPGDSCFYGTAMFGKKNINNRRNNDRFMQDYAASVPGLKLFLVSDAGAARLFGKSGSGIFHIKEGTRINTALTADFKPELHSYSSENVIAMIEGSKYKDQFIVIGAHYDHLGMNNGKTYYGADDNASGTAAVIEVAKALAEATKNGYRPERSILFMAFTAEEKGLLGSDFYVKSPLKPLESTVLMINMDMIGRTDKNHYLNQDYTYIMAVGDHKCKVKKMAKNASRKTDGLMLDKHPGLIGRLGYFFGSDHFSFWKKDVPAVVFFSGLHKDYHKPSDTPDKVKYKQIEKVSRMVFELAKEAAGSEKLRP